MRYRACSTPSTTTTTTTLYRVLVAYTLFCTPSPLFQSASALVVRVQEGVDLEGPTYGNSSIFEHMVANFGPQSINLTNTSLILAGPDRWGCNHTATEPSYEGKVVLILRGSEVDTQAESCNFVWKCLGAEQRGAAAVIVGNCNQSDHGHCSDRNSAPNALVAMSADEEYTGPLPTIPSIFVRYGVYSLLREAIEAAEDGDLSPIRLNLQQEDPDDPDDGDNPNSSPIIVTIDERGKRVEPFRRVSILSIWRNIIIIVPILFFCGTVCLVLCVRQRMSQRRRQARIDAGALRPDEVGGHDAAATLQLVTFRRLSNAPSGDELSAGADSSSSQFANKVRNESCAICLEDFSLGTEVKLLPCGHAYHQNCIDPWLRERSELCPICKRSVYADPVANGSSSSSSLAAGGAAAVVSSSASSNGNSGREPLLNGASSNGHQASSDVVVDVQLPPAASSSNGHSRTTSRSRHISASS